MEAEAFLITSQANVRYLTGFSGSNGQLIVTADGGIFLTDGRYVEQSRHEVPDIRRSFYSGSFSPAFRTACQELGAGRVAFESGHLTYQAYLDLSGTGVSLVPASGEVERLRLVKDEEERKCLDAAQAIADEAFEAITALLAEGMTERQAALALDVELQRRDADGLSFDTILAFGENAAEPHHRPTDRPLRRGDLVKMDFGCVVKGYHSDMTRTVALGEPPASMKDVYEVVRRAQEAGVQAVRPGVSGDEADRAARSVIEEAGLGEGFRHGLGHGVGLEIHEGPSLRRGGNDRLPEGTVVTVEPGVYLEGVGGVRIEDMVEVTALGPRVIPSVSKQLIVL